MNLDIPVTNHLPPAVVKGIVVLLAVLVIYLGIKIAHFVIKMGFILLGLALVGGLIWWEFFR